MHEREVFAVVLWSTFDDGDDVIDDWVVVVVVPDCPVGGVPAERAVGFFGEDSGAELSPSVSV